MKLSELAGKLWPYLRSRVESVVSNSGATSGASGGGALSAHSLSGGYHTGTLSDAQGPQFLLTDGTRALTGNLSVSAGVTIDGVDIGAHASRHASGGGDAVDHDTLTNFVADEHIAHSGVTLTAGDGLTGGGTIAASRSFAVGAGDGIDVAADSVAVDVTDIIDTSYGLTESTNNIRVNLAATSGLEFSTGALQVNDTIAGAGLTIASKILAVGAGDGIDVAADAVLVDVTDILGTGLTEDGSNNIVLPEPDNVTVATTNTRDATGHTHAVTSSSNPGAAASLLATDANGTLALDTDTLYVSATQDAVWVNSGTPDGSAAFKVQAAATNDITFYTKQIAAQTADMWRVEDSSGQALILLQEDGSLESGNPGFTSGLTGWQITPTGDVEFNNGFFRGELHASIFVVDEIHATGGSLFVATAGKLLSNTDTSAGATSIGLGMENGDILLMESGDLLLMEVADAFALDIEDPQSGHAQIFNIGDTLRLKTWNGTGVYDNWLSVVAVEDQTTYYRYYVRLVSGTGATIPAGTAVVSYGAEGDGRILITSDQNSAPYIDVFSVGPSPWTGAAGAIIPHVRMGRLDGVGVVGTEQYGIVMGSDLSDTSLDAQYIIASDQQLRLNNVDLTIYDASNNPTVSLTSAGALKMGTDIDAAATTGFSFDATTGDLRIGRDSNYVLWDDSVPSLSVSLAGGIIKMDSDGLSIEASTTYAETRSLEFVNASDARIAGVYGTVSSSNANIWVESFAESTGDAYAALVANADTDQYARVTLSANDGTNAAYLYVIQGASTDRNEVYVENATFRIGQVSAPGTNPASGSCYLYLDSGDGDLKVLFSNGTSATLATN